MPRDHDIDRSEPSGIAEEQSAHVTHAEIADGALIDELQAPRKRHPGGSAKRSRRKGAERERECGARLRAELGWNLKRDLEQSRKPGHADLVSILDAGGDPVEGTPAISVECKSGQRQIPLCCYKWLAQNDADLVAMRRDGEGWLLVMEIPGLGNLLAWATEEGRREERTKRRSSRR